MSLSNLYNLNPGLFGPSGFLFGVTEGANIAHEMGLPVNERNKFCISYGILPGYSIYNRIAHFVFINLLVSFYAFPNFLITLNLGTVIIFPTLFTKYLSLLFNNKLLGHWKLSVIKSKQLK